MRKSYVDYGENIIPLFLRGTQIGAVFLIPLYAALQLFNLIFILPIWILIAEILIRYLKNKGKE